MTTKKPTKKQIQYACEDIKNLMSLMQEYKIEEIQVGDICLKRRSREIFITELDEKVKEDNFNREINAGVRSVR